MPSTEHKFKLYNYKTTYILYRNGTASVEQLSTRYNTCDVVVSSLFKDEVVSSYLFIFKLDKTPYHWIKYKDYLELDQHTIILLSRYNGMLKTISLDLMLLD